MECMPNSHYEECTSVNLQTCADKDRVVPREPEDECTEGKQRCYAVKFY